MNLVSWRFDQLLVLTMAVVLSVGAGFVGGYALRAAKPVAGTPAAPVTLTSTHEKSYERLLRESGRWSEADEPFPIDEANERARVICEEVPMDGLIGGRGPPVRLSELDTPLPVCPPPR